MVELPMSCVMMYIFLLRHIRNDDLCGYENTPYDIITSVHLCCVRHIRNEDICGGEKKLRVHI